MRRSLLLLVLCSAVKAPYPANVRALGEADQYLPGCREGVSASNIRVCQSLQNTFRENYVRAWTGNALSMKNLAAYFAPRPTEADAISAWVRPSKVESCAWAMAVQTRGVPAEDGTPIDSMRYTHCGNSLSDADIADAERRASYILHRIDTTPTHWTNDWSDDCHPFDPKLAAYGRLGSARCKRPAKLDSSVAPFLPSQ